MPKLELSEKELLVIRSLIKLGLEDFENGEKIIRDIPPQFLESEEQYETLLNNLLKKVS